MIYLFDVDGTLTPPMDKMDSVFAVNFINWVKGKKVYIVAGSGIDKVNKQIPHSVISRCSGVFTSMANELWINNKLVLKNEWEPSEELINFLNYEVANSKYTNKKSNHIEKRSGMINFSTLGRDASKEERNNYFNWDAENKEREKVKERISNKFSDLDVRIGGQISMDISPKGNNKSLATKWIRNNSKDQMTYFGDKCDEGGNDYDAVEDIINNKDGLFFKVRDWQHTMRILLGDY